MIKLQWPQIRLTVFKKLLLPAKTTQSMNLSIFKITVRNITLSKRLLIPWYH